MGRLQPGSHASTPRTAVPTPSATLTPQLCVPRIAAGAACDINVNLGDSCDSGHCRDGRCKPAEQVQEVGEDCLYTFGPRTDCQPGLHCEAIDGGYYFGKCAPGRLAGFPCVHNGDCAAGLVCSPELVCRKAPKAGEPCNPTWPYYGVGEQCAEMLECRKQPDGGGLCETLRRRGDDCSDLSTPGQPDPRASCYDPLAGFSGWCLPDDGGYTCQPPPNIPVGQTCTSPYVCESFRCLQSDGGFLREEDAGTCAAACP